MVFRRIICFFFIDTCNKDTLEGTVTWEKKLNFIHKAHQLLLENSIAEKNGHIYRTDQKTLQSIYRKDLTCRKTKTDEQILQISVHPNMTTFKQAIFQQKILLTLHASTSE